MKLVTAAIIIKDKKVLVARRSKDDKLAGKWEFPGGKIEPGESPEECLKRELKEELGVDAVVGVFFDESIYNYDHGVIKLLAYFVSIGNEVICCNVHDEVRWEPVEKLCRLDLAPADIPLVKKLTDFIQQGQAKA